MSIGALQEARPVEVRQDEESRILAEVSVSTLLYMRDHGLAWEERLRRHRVNLGYFADDEWDLLEAMQLETRLSRVERNITRLGRRNERIRSELINRQMGPG